MKTTLFAIATFNSLLRSADTAVLQLQEYVVQTGAERTVVMEAVTRFVAAEHKLEVKEGKFGLTFDAPAKLANKAIDRRSYLKALIYKTGKGSVDGRNNSDPYATIVGAGKRARKAGISLAKAIAAFTKGYDAAK